MSALGAAISGAFGLGGGVASAMMSSRQAKKNRKFQERMARHAHRYEMEDLRKAGLNPILTGKYGGAATPGGSMAPVPDLSGVAANAAGAGARLTEAKSSKELRSKQEELIGKQQDQIQADIELKEAQARKADAEAVAAGRWEPVGRVGGRFGEWIEEGLDRGIFNAYGGSAMTEALRSPSLKDLKDKDKTITSFGISKEFWSYLEKHPSEMRKFRKMKSSEAKAYYEAWERKSR